MPKRTLAPLPKPIAIPEKVSIKDKSVQDAFTLVERQLNAHTKYLRSTITQPQMAQPSGPNSVSVGQFGGTFTISFQSDQSGPYITHYKIYRAQAGNRSSPSTPSSDSGICIAVLPSHGPEDTSFYRYVDRSLSIAQLDPANPVRFQYFVTSVDDRDNESIFVPAPQGPVETLTNGPGDQSPEMKLVPGNKLFNPSPLRNDASAVALSIDNAFPITSSTNATPIVVTIGAHTFVVGDFVAVDGHLVNTNANGWWKVSVIGGTTITLTNPLTGANAIGNGVGAATGNVYRASKTLGGTPPYTHPSCSVANGNTVDWTSPWATQLGAGTLNYCRYIPWYSEQAGLITVGVGGAFGGVFQMPAPAAAAQTSFAQEVGNRGFIGGGRMTFSVMAYWNLLPSNSVMTLQVLDTGGTVLFTNDFSTLTLNVQKFVFNFALGTVSGNPTGRLKFRIINKNISGTGQILLVFAPMVSCGDVAPPFSSITDYSDYPAPITNDLFIGTWSRTVQQTLVRDSSAPYS
jgi:hypothetical protein